VWISPLLPQYLLNLADLFLGFGGSLFGVAFGCQLGLLAEFLKRFIPPFQQQKSQLGTALFAIC
jgi:hypothetical protein